MIRLNKVDLHCNCTTCLAENLLAVLHVTVYYTSCHAIGPSIRWPYVEKVWSVFEKLYNNPNYCRILIGSRL